MFGRKTFTFDKLSSEQKSAYGQLYKDYQYWHDDPTETKPGQAGVDIHGRIKWFDIGSRLFKAFRMYNETEKIFSSSSSLVTFMVNASSDYKTIDYNTFGGFPEELIDRVEEGRKQSR